MLIALGALLLRLYYVHTAIVDHPIHGDAVQYYAYAWNLVHHGVFSGALPDATTISPDSFRDPGYPVFLATVLGTSSPDTFVDRVTGMQCLLSATTVWIYAVLARRWIGFPAAIGASVLLAIWPHTITLADYVLSETLLGFLVAIALVLADQAWRRGGTGRPLAAGLGFALAGLTNAVMAPFGPILAAVMLWRVRSQRRLWMLVLLAAIVPLAAWSLRAMAVSGTGESAGDRVKMNLVQGSWPEYHAAYLFSEENANAAAIMKTIDVEYRLLRSDTPAGMGRIVDRLGREPVRYIGWYLSKPLELWGWDIGIGAGDIYVYPTYRSPLLMQPLLAGVVGALYFLSPFILLLAATGAVMAVGSPGRDAPGMRLAAGLALWVTVVYGVLQSDARYSTPFRGLEMMLAVFAVHVVTTRLYHRKRLQNGRNAS